MARNKLLLGSLAALALVGLAGGLTVTAYAQSDSGEGPNWHRRGGPRAGILSEYIDHEAVLAEEQDVDLADLREIQEAYRQQAIAEALESGAIDDSQAEWLAAMPAAGFRHFSMGSGDRSEALDLQGSTEV